MMTGAVALLQISPCGPERAQDVHRLTQAAFGGYRRLDPPSGAVRESVAHVASDLAAGGGAIAEVDDRAVGCLRFHLSESGDLHVRRVAVDPEVQGRGIGRELMAWAEREARRRGCEAISVGVRTALPGNLAFYRKLGYSVIGERRHDGYDRTTWLALRKRLPGRGRRTRAEPGKHGGRVTVVKLSARIEALPLEEPFVIARDTTTEAEVVWVEIEHEGERGYGEAAPIDRYDESAQSALAYVEDVADSLGEGPFALDEIEERLPRREYAARAAIDGALHDLCGKLTGLPVWRLLGLRQAGPPTSWTIGLADPDETARKAEQVTRFTSLKLKLGGRDGQDVERVRAVRSVWAGPIRVDVNEYWTLAEALESIPQLAELGVDYVEQPLPARDPAGRELKERSLLPIYVDEDCHTLKDIHDCAQRSHGINIKLAKSGGIREAVRMAHAARALGLGVMLGCMVESGLGIAAGASIASLCDHVDLDGNLLLREDPWPGVELVDGVQLPSDSPGLGVRAPAGMPR